MIVRHVPHSVAFVPAGAAGLRTADGAAFRLETTRAVQVRPLGLRRILLGQRQIWDSAAGATGLVTEDGKAFLCM